MTTEREVYNLLKKNFPMWDWQRIENAVSSGIPDVNVAIPVAKQTHGIEVWIELKVNEPLLRPAQLAWHIRAGVVKRRAWVMVYIPKARIFEMYQAPFECRTQKEKMYIISPPNILLTLDNLDSLPIFLTK